MDLNKLDEPFAPNDVEWRIQQAKKGGQAGVWCMVLCYVTNRAIMNRLDKVCGKANWSNQFKATDKAIECGISVKAGDEWITKWDAAEETQIEAVKGGRSGAMKRAAVQWGIGRYLYNLEATFANVVVNNKRPQGENWNKGSVKDGQGWITYWWQTPTLPDWALPPVEKPDMATVNKQAEAAIEKWKLKGLPVEGCIDNFQSKYKVSAEAIQLIKETYEGV